MAKRIPLIFRSTNCAASADKLNKSKLAYEKLLKREDLGFFKVHERDQIWTQSEKWGENFANNASDILVFGIGGSSLGAEFLVDVSDKKQSAPNIHFLDNVDPWLVNKIFDRVSDWSKCYFLIISKSGNTLETLTLADLVMQLPQIDKNKFIEKCLIISEPKNNALTDWARAYNIPQLDLPIDIGGRFSVMTPVGLVLARACGTSLSDFREGCRLAVESRDLIIQISAQALDSFSREEWITFLWNYSSSLKYFGLWFEQLWAESLSKKIDRRNQPAPRASTPVSALGVCDQHSLLQQVMEGAKDKWVVQVRVDDLEGGPAAKALSLTQSEFAALDWRKARHLGDVLAAEAEATRLGLEQNQISITNLSLTDLGPRSVGYLLMFWQLVVGTLGEAMDIDAFNQPGVELGKRLAKEILQKSIDQD